MKNRYTRLILFLICFALVSCTSRDGANSNKEIELVPTYSPYDTIRDNGVNSFNVNGYEIQLTEPQKDKPFRYYLDVDRDRANKFILSRCQVDEYFQAMSGIYYAADIWNKDYLGYSEERMSELTIYLEQNIYGKLEIVVGDNYVDYRSIDKENGYVKSKDVNIEFYPTFYDDSGVNPFDDVYLSDVMYAGNERTPYQLTPQRYTEFTTHIRIDRRNNEVKLLMHVKYEADWMVRDSFELIFKKK